jgi:hypothetical protein
MKRTRGSSRVTGLQVLNAFYGFVSLVMWEVNRSDENSSICRYLLRYFLAEHFLAWRSLYLIISLFLAP